MYNGNLVKAARSTKSELRKEFKRLTRHLGPRVKLLGYPIDGADVASTWLIWPRNHKANTVYLSIEKWYSEAVFRYTVTTAATHPHLSPWRERAINPERFKNIAVCMIRQYLSRSLYCQKGL